MITENPVSSDRKLVAAPGLLVALFAEDARPSLRWLRAQTAARAIPYIKIGGKVLFDVDEVRAALRRENTVRPAAEDLTIRAKSTSRP